MYILDINSITAPFVLCCVDVEYKHVEIIDIFN